MSDYKGFLDLELTSSQLTEINAYLKKKLKKNYQKISFALISQPSVVRGNITIKLLSVREFQKIQEFFEANDLLRNRAIECRGRGRNEQ